jgi:hypothetical protein
MVKLPSFSEDNSSGGRPPPFFKNGKVFLFPLEEGRKLKSGATPPQSGREFKIGDFKSYSFLFHPLYLWGEFPFTLTFFLFFLKRLPSFCYLLGNFAPKWTHAPNLI